MSEDAKKESAVISVEAAREKLKSLNPVHFLEVGAEVFKELDKAIEENHDFLAKPGVMDWLIFSEELFRRYAAVVQMQAMAASFLNDLAETAVAASAANVPPEKRS
jgi:hypothetical protein